MNLNEIKSIIHTHDMESIKEEFDKMSKEDKLDIINNNFTYIYASLPAEDKAFIKENKKEDGTFTEVLFHFFSLIDTNPGMGLIKNKAQYILQLQNVKEK